MDLARIQALREACEARDHTRIESLLNGLETDEDTAQAMQLVLQQLEGSDAVLHYLLPFLEWYLQQGQWSTASSLMRQCREASAVFPDMRDRVAGLIYQHLVKPNEARWREQYDAAYSLLAPHIRVGDPAAANFEEVARRLVYLPLEEERADIPEEDSSACLLVDVLDLKTVAQVGARRFCYLVYEDADRFYALLFRDLTPILPVLQRYQILIFVGRDRQVLERHLSNARLRLPRQLYCAHASRRGDYEQLLTALSTRRSERLLMWGRSLDSYYGRFTPAYYKGLFEREPALAKVLVITTIHSYITQYIAKTWLEGFRELGYNVRLLIEDDPHERIDSEGVCETLYDFRPDFVFHINIAVGDVVPGEQTRRNLLWLLRRRDVTTVDAGVAYEHNMFLIQMVSYWVEEAAKAGHDRRRVHYLPDGVNTDAFTPPVWHERREYDCDVVTVTNSSVTDAGLVLRSLPHPMLTPIITELFADLEEMARQDQFLYHPSKVEPLLDVKLRRAGVTVDAAVRNLITMHAITYCLAWSRRKSVEWILDAGITRNIQVWGLGWERYPHLEPFHKGLVRHGKPLSRVYRRAKISISDHAMIEMHERNFEIMASGGFPLVRRVYPQAGEPIERITDYLEEGREVVMYYDKEDYLQKMAYYLEHPQKRDDIAAAGMARARQAFNSVEICRQAIAAVKQYFVS